MCRASDSPYVVIRINTFGQLIKDPWLFKIHGFSRSMAFRKDTPTLYGYSHRKKRQGFDLLNFGGLLRLQRPEHFHHGVGGT